MVPNPVHGRQQKASQLTATAPGPSPSRELGAPRTGGPIKHSIHTEPQIRHKLIVHLMKFCQFTQADWESQWKGKCEKPPLSLKKWVDDSIAYWQSLNLPVHAYVVWGASHNKPNADILDAYLIDRFVSLSKAFEKVYAPGLRIKVLIDTLGIELNNCTDATKNYIGQIKGMLIAHPDVFDISDTGKYWGKSGMNVPIFKKLAGMVRDEMTETDVNIDKILEMRPKLWEIARGGGLNSKVVSQHLDELSEMADVFQSHRDAFIQQAEINFDGDSLLGAVTNFIRQPCENVALSQHPLLDGVIGFVLYPTTSASDAVGRPDSAYLHLYPEPAIPMHGIINNQSLSIPPWMIKRGEELAQKNLSDPWIPTHREEFVISPATLARLERTYSEQLKAA